MVGVRHPTPWTAPRIAEKHWTHRHADAPDRDLGQGAGEHRRTPAQLGQAAETAAEGQHAGAGEATGERGQVLVRMHRRLDLARPPGERRDGHHAYEEQQAGDEENATLYDSYVRALYFTTTTITSVLDSILTTIRTRYGIMLQDTGTLAKVRTPPTTACNHHLNLLLNNDHN